MMRGRLSLFACARRCELFGAMMLGALIVATMLCLAGCSAPASSEDAHDVALTGAATLGRVSVGCPDGLMERVRDDESRQVTTTTPDGASKSYGHKQAFYDKGDSMTVEEGVTMLMLHEYEGVTFEEALAYTQDKAHGRGRCGRKCFPDRGEVASAGRHGSEYDGGRRIRRT